MGIVGINCTTTHSVLLNGGISKQRLDDRERICMASTIFF